MSSGGLLVGAPTSTLVTGACVGASSESTLICDDMTTERDDRRPERSHARCSQGGTGISQPPRGETPGTRHMLQLTLVCDSVTVLKTETMTPGRLPTKGNVWTPGHTSDGNAWTPRPKETTLALLLDRETPQHHGRRVVAYAWQRMVTARHPLHAMAHAILDHVYDTDIVNAWQPDDRRQ